nr:MAG TPA: hypothetical protein [Caudoviricetes sp.]
MNSPFGHPYLEKASSEAFSFLLKCAILKSRKQ